ncbi:hypothetical protein JCM3774_003723 [Rhodotorula dairenensis]
MSERRSLTSARGDASPAKALPSSASTPPRPYTPATTAPPEQTAQPFLPDEVLDALARDPPRPSLLVAPPIAAFPPARSTPPTRQSAAFDKSYLFDVPSLIGPSGSSNSSLLTSERRSTLLRNVSHTRTRSLAGSPSFEGKSDSAAEAPQLVRRRGPTRSPHSSAWSRIANAGTPDSAQLGDRSPPQSSPRSERSFIGSSRAGTDRRSDSSFHLPRLEAGGSPGLERALAELALTAPVDGDPEEPGSAIPAHVPDADFVVAVVGPKAVGKSTLIRRGLKRACSEPLQLLVEQNGHLASSTFSSFTMAGIRHSIRVVEVDSELFSWNDAAKIPQAEAILLCYDASDPDALSGLSRFLRALSTRGADVPLIVLACKSSAIGNDAVDPQAAVDLCDTYGAGIVRLDGGTEDPQRKSKECFSWVIKQIMDNRGKMLSFAALTTPTQEGSALQLQQQQEPPHIVENLCVVTPDVPDLASLPWSLGLAETAPVTITSPTRRDSESALLGGVAGSRTQESPDRLLFRPEDLVDKFLHASVAGDDDEFMTAFLITFRRFVRPLRVLEQLVARFRFVSEQTLEMTLKRYGQLRLSSTLSMWLQSYPGDFADSATLDCLRHFVEIDLSHSGTWLSHHVYELTPLLPSIARITDPDAGWSISGNDLAQQDPSDRPRPRSQVFLPTNRSQASLASTTCSSDAPSLTEDGIASSARYQHSDGVSLDSRSSATGSASIPMKRELSGVTALLVETSNALVEVSAQDIAVQITRLAWDSFAGITPRDAMRHVLARKEESQAVKKSPIARSIDFVNHLARWVATMILVQSRPKSRALLVEKFVFVAGALRLTENFDSLMGVLAGLNSQAVHRLTDTFEAVTDALDERMVRTAPGEPKQPKKLRSLNLLMSPAKSFAAYRLALSASSRDALPYLGVILQDLTVINETSPDFDEGLVNWSKFANFRRSCSILLDCPKTPPTLPVDRAIEGSILDVPLLNEDRLYALSYAYQPRDGKSAGRSRLREIARNALA